MLFASRRSRAALVALASALFFFLLPYFILGLDPYYDFVEKVLPQSAKYLSSVGNHSLLGALADAGHPGASFVLCLGLLVIASGIAHLRRDPDSVWICAVSVSLLASPLSWGYYFILVLSPLIVLKSRLGMEPPARRVIMGFLVVGLLFWPGLFGGFLPLLPATPLIFGLINYLPTACLVGLLISPLWIKSTDPAL